MAAHTPIALPRSRAGKTFVMIDSVAGMMNAPPTPMTARLTIREVGESAIADDREPSPKTTKPTCRAGRRPKRSPRLPAVSSSPAKTRM